MSTSPQSFVRFVRRSLAAAAAAALGAAFVFPADAATIRIARGALPPSLGVPFTSIGPPSSEVWTALFDALTRIDPKGDVQPALALSWESTKPTTWRFKLRPGVTYHDGTPFNAAAVVANFDMLRRPENAKFYIASEVRNIAGVRRIDDLTVEFDTREPDAVLPRRMNMIYIVSPTAWTTLGEAGFAQKPSGTGPFRLVDWGKGPGLTKLQAFPQSWRKPKVDNIELFTVTEPVRRVQALLSGQIDIATKLGPDELRQLPEKGFTVRTLEKPLVMSIVFRTAGREKSPVSDVRVREALSLVIDRQGLSQSVFEGRFKPANQGAAPMTQGFNPDLPPIALDPARAKKLLADAGYAKGFKLRIAVFLGQLSSDELVYQQVAQSIRQLGVDVDLRAIPYAQWLQSYLSNEWGDVDAFGFAWDSGGMYDAARPMETSSCLKDRPFFCETSLLPAMREVAGEMDPAKRLPKLRALAAQMRNLYPAIWILTAADDTVARDAVVGLEPWHMGLQYEHLALK